MGLGRRPSRLVGPTRPSVGLSYALTSVRVYRHMFRCVKTLGEHPQTAECGTRHGENQLEAEATAPLAAGRTGAVKIGRPARFLKVSRQDEFLFVNTE
jgi:hypothetical protein